MARAAAGRRLTPASAAARQVTSRQALHDLLLLCCPEAHCSISSSLTARTELLGPRSSGHWTRECPLNCGSGGGSQEGVAGAKRTAPELPIAAIAAAIGGAATAAAASNGPPGKRQRQAKQGTSAQALAAFFQPRSQQKAAAAAARATLGFGSRRRRGGSDNRPCYRCGKTGHFAKDCHIA